MTSSVSRQRGSLEKCGRTVFKIVSPTDDFKTIKNGITLVARLLQYFPCLCGPQYLAKKVRAL